MSSFKEDMLAVHNSRGFPVGFLYKKGALYLRQLMEEGKVYADGSIWYHVKDRKKAIPCGLSIFLSPKGMNILKPKKVRSAEDIIHNHLVAAFHNEAKHKEEVIHDLADYYYRPVCDSDRISNESKLIFNMLTWKAIWDSNLQPMIEEMVKKKLEGVED